VQELSDENLVAKFRTEAGSPGAEIWINELFQRYHARVAAWCLRFTGDRQSAADLAQDIFLKAYRNLDSFRGDAKFSTWLFSISRNHCVNEIKSRSSRPEDTSDPVVLDLTAGKAESVLQSLENEESLASMRNLIEETLDETEKKVMSLHYAEEITLDAITRLLGLTNASGAKAYVVSAKRKLAASLQRWKAREERGTRYGLNHEQF
jgi:RNA polymerase sigma factor (sigma-70 family)